MLSKVYWLRTINYLYYYCILFSCLLYLAPNNTKMPISYKLSEPKNSNRCVVTTQHKKNQQIKTTESFYYMVSVIKDIGIYFVYII